MAEHLSDHDYRRSGDWSAAARGDFREPADVDGDHLLMMHLLYVRAAGKGPGLEYREGYASLDSLREVSGLPAWRVWELIEDLQELDLVHCIWDSRAQRGPASAGASGELRFLRCTRAGLTDAGRSYPPLLEYHRLREQRRWETGGLSTGRARQRQTQTRRRPLGYRPRWKSQPARGYQIYRPQAQAARRLAYLAVTLCVALLVLAVYLAASVT